MKKSATLTILNDYICENTNNLSINQVDSIINYLNNEILENSYKENKLLLNKIFEELPTYSLMKFLDRITQIIEKEQGKTLIFYLINSKKPIYQIKGLQMISTLRDKSFTAFVTKLLFSTYIPLKKQAIRTLLEVPGNSESILEQYLNKRSGSQKEIVEMLLKQINPYNKKLALKMLESEDFLKRIEGIKILAKSGNKKWIEKFQHFLKDSDIAVQKAAIDGISEIGGRKANKILNSKLIQEEFPPLRKIIIQNLKKK